jgi:ABC-type transporter Mla MlaB component
MLRIHVEEQREPAVVTLRLEGKLVQPWVDELHRTWSGLAGRLPLDCSIRIDLNAVSFVDEYGRSILAALHRVGCQLHGSAPFIAAVIEECLVRETGQIHELK